jgi:creatinine amidohydrolase
MRLRELEWQEVQRYLEGDDRIILPVGSVEQHGPFGVFGTDHLIPDAIASDVAERTGTLAAPVLPYGMSEHHMAFPGTMSLAPTTFIRVMVDLLTALSRHGFRRVLVLNGHGGNIAPAHSAIAAVCHRETDLRIKFFSWWEKEEIQSIIDSTFGAEEGQHGTPSEISIVMHLHPGMVRKRAVPVQEKHVRRCTANYLRLRELFPDGSINADPNLASAEAGRRLFEACVEAYAEEMEEWE